LLARTTDPAERGRIWILINEERQKQKDAGEKIEDE
jgi:hypothetical protein